MYSKKTCPECCMEIPLLASKCPYCRSEVNLSSSSFWDSNTELEEKVSKKVAIVALLLSFIATHFVTTSFFGDKIHNTLQYWFVYIFCFLFVAIPVGILPVLFVKLCIRIASCFIDFD